MTERYDCDATFNDWWDREVEAGRALRNADKTLALRAWLSAWTAMLARASLPESQPRKLWLWKNFVDGRPEYWAFDNPYPTKDGGDPLVLGEPCGYAIFKPSTKAPGHDESDEEVLAAVQRAASRSATQPFQQKWESAESRIASLEALVEDLTVSAGAWAETCRGLEDKVERMRPSAEAVKIAGLVLIADKYAFPPVYGSHLAVPMLATTILRIAEATKL